MLRRIATYFQLGIHGLRSFIKKMVNIIRILHASFYRRLLRFRFVYERFFSNFGFISWIRCISKCRMPWLGLFIYHKIYDKNWRFRKIKNNQSKTPRLENPIQRMAIIVYLQWNWLLLHPLTVISNFRTHIRTPMIAYRIKVVAELTEDVTTKTPPTNMRATMEQIHFLWQSVLPSGEKDRHQGQSGIQYVTYCRETRPRSPV